MRMSNPARSEIVEPDARLEILTSLKHLNLEELKREADETLDLTIPKILKLGCILHLASKMNPDLSWFRLSLRDSLRRVGAGELLPGIVMKFAESKVFERVARLQLADQQRLASKEKIEVQVWDGPRAFDTRMLEFDSLTPAQRRQVLDGDKLRNADAQRAYLQDQRTKLEVQKSKTYKPRLDLEHDVLIIGGKRAKIEDIQEVFHAAGLSLRNVRRREKQRLGA